LFALEGHHAVLATLRAGMAVPWASRCSRWCEQTCVVKGAAERWRAGVAAGAGVKGDESEAWRRRHRKCGMTVCGHGDDEGVELVRVKVPEGPESGCLELLGHPPPTRIGFDDSGQLGPG
jgi:hypothetical protein